MPGRPHLILAAAALLLTACSSGKVPIDSVDVSAEDDAACAALVDALPDTLDGELRRSVDPEDALGAAWGDPAYVLTCGVARPSSYTRDAECNVMRGVGWFVPEDQLRDPRVDATAYALTHLPHVELVVPSRYRSQGVDQALAELAPVIKEHLRAAEPCL